MKHKTNQFLRCSAAAIAVSALTLHTQAADLTWNNGASTGNWNTSDANWTGSIWNNGTPDNAIFFGTGGTVSLDTGITAGSVSIGNTGGNFANLTLQNGSLTASSLTVQGWGNNSGAYGSNPSLAVNSTVNISGDAGIGRANLNITGGTFTANRIISAAGSADWGRLVISGGTVTATNGVDGSVNTGATFQMDLNGGTLYTPFIKVADREAGSNNNAWLTFNGGTVKAMANTTTFITTYGGGNNVYIAGGGAIIDSNGYDITIGTVLRGGGSLSKNGSGTLTLTQQNGYTGGTTVNQGTLVLGGGAWTLDNVSGGGVTVGSGATLRADNSVANQINGLTLNSGTVEAINSAGNGDWGNFFLTGNVTATGSSTLNADVALRASNVDFNVASGGALNVGGTLHNGAFFGIYSGAPATVSKSGDGSMVVTGAHSYTGATTVSGGSLIVNGNISTSATTVANSATLGGTGTVGTTTVNGIFAPGNSIGTLNVIGTLDLNGISNFEIDPTLGVGLDRAADLANVTGSISYGGILNVLYGGSASDFTNGMTFNLFDATGGFTDSFNSVNLPSLTGGLSWQNNLATTGSITVVPEPASALLGGLGLLMLLRRRR